MSPSTKQVLQTALSLPLAEQLELIEALIAAVDQTNPPPFDDAYLAEIKRRSAQIEAGEAVLTPWSEVKRRVRERVEARVNG